MPDDVSAVGLRELIALQLVPVFDFALREIHDPLAPVRNGVLVALDQRGRRGGATVALPLEDGFPVDAAALGLKRRGVLTISPLRLRVPAGPVSRPAEQAELIVLGVRWPGHSAKSPRRLVRSEHARPLSTDLRRLLSSRPRYRSTPSGHLVGAQERPPVVEDQDAPEALTDAEWREGAADPNSVCNTARSVAASPRNPSGSGGCEMSR